MIFLLAFESTHDALAALKLLDAYHPQVLPVPKEITAGCGMAVRFEAKDEQEAREIVSRAALSKDTFALYEKEGQSYIKVEGLSS